MAMNIHYRPSWFIAGLRVVILPLCFSDEKLDLNDSKWEDIHVITGALKMFFRELPEPLFTYSHFNDFVNAISKFVPKILCQPVQNSSHVGGHAVLNVFLSWGNSRQLTTKNANNCRVKQFKLIKRRKHSQMNLTSIAHPLSTSHYHPFQKQNRKKTQVCIVLGPVQSL